MPISFHNRNIPVKPAACAVSISGNGSRRDFCQNRNMPIKIHDKGRRPAHVYLKEWLEYRHLTAEQLSHRLEVSKSVISKLMNGKQRYNQDWLEMIAYALSCEVPDLYRLPTAPTANELLAQMSPQMREAALNVLIEFAKAKTGTDG